MLRTPMARIAVVLLSGGVLASLPVSASAQALEDPADQWLPRSDGASWTYAWSNSAYSPAARTEQYGLQARVGTISTPPEHFSEWKTMDPAESQGKSELDVMLRGAFSPERHVVFGGPALVAVSLQGNCDRGVLPQNLGIVLDVLARNVRECRRVVVESHVPEHSLTFGGGDISAAEARFALRVEIGFRERSIGSAAVL